MKTLIRFRICAVAVLLSVIWFGLASTKPTVAQTSKSKTTVSEKSVRSYMNALASDEMRGRGSYVRHGHQAYTEMAVGVHRQPHPQHVAQMRERLHLPQTAPIMGIG